MVSIDAEWPGKLQTNLQVLVNGLIAELIWHGELTGFATIRQVTVDLKGRDTLRRNIDENRYNFFGGGR